jgi:hypothetical protein
MCTFEEVKTRLTEDTCYHSVQNQLSSRVQSKMWRTKCERLWFYPLVCKLVKLCQPLARTWIEGVWKQCAMESNRMEKELGLKFRIVFWDVLPCKIIVDRRFRGTCCLQHQLFYTAVHPRRQFWTSYSPPWELEISQRVGMFIVCTSHQMLLLYDCHIREDEVEGTCSVHGEN